MLTSSRWDLHQEYFWRDAAWDEAGVIHGVTARKLGNMKDAAARAAALEKAGLGGRPAFLLKQTHGTGIIALDSSTPPDNVPEGDGWITDTPGRVLCVFVADCLPLFLRDSKGKAAGVFHVGWKGAQAGMPREAVAAFARIYGIKAGELKASLGPHIGPCCYRVGPEMSSKFRAASLISRDAGLYLDLGAEVEAQLLESGMNKEDIAASDACTSCGADLFYSFRREKQDCRMMAFLSLG